MDHARWAAPVCALLLGATGCVSAQTRRDYDEVSRALAHEAGSRSLAPPSRASPDRDDEALLAREVRLDVALRVALTQNPALHEARMRARADLERARSLSHLPDLELKYELWGAPLARPYALDQAQTHMFGVRQAFPAPGSLDARARAALEDARAALQGTASRSQDVAVQVRRAHAAYVRADHERAVHLGHVELASGLATLARAHYATGKVNQQDVLRIVVELSKLHTQLSAIDQRVASSKAMLNVLMGRPADAPLGPPIETSAPTGDLRVAELVRALRARRPELRAALSSVGKSEALLDDARAKARWPNVMVGLDYWLMPTLPEPHGYGAMVSMNLPWLNPAHAEEVTAAEHTVLADRQGVVALESALAYELRDTAARFDAAREQLAILERDLLPQARQSFDAARAAFAGGGADVSTVLDAFRAYLDVHLEHARATAAVTAAWADVERAAGAPLEALREPQEGSDGR